LLDTLTATLAIVAACWLVQKKPALYKNNEAMQFAFALAAGALLFGAALFATGIYPPFATRRNSWILPFIIPAAGWLLVVFYQYSTTIMQKAYVHASIVLILLLIPFVYSTEGRFSDQSEYVIKKPVQEKTLAALAQLTDKDIIIAEKDDAVFLTNIYPFLTFDDKKLAAIAPYNNTSILINPYYPRFYNRETLLNTLQQASGLKLLEGKERLVFFRMVWSRSPVADLMLCQQLNKHIQSFSVDYVRDESKPLTRDDILKTSVMIMTVDKDEFIRAVLPENGVARICLNGVHDQTTVAKNGSTTP
jgi:hypothetical protein